MPKLKKKTIYVFILILIALYVVIFVIPSITGALEPTEVLEYGELKVTTETKCYIIRDETVYGAPGAGSIKYRASEGTLIKKGVETVSFSARKIPKDEEAKEEPESKYKQIMTRLRGTIVTDKNSHSLRKGIFTTYVDGYEKQLNIRDREKLTYSTAQSIKEEPQDIKRKEVEVKNDPIYKICDNAKWYMVMWIEEAEISRYEEGKELTAVLGESEIGCTVDNVSQEEDGWRVILRTNRYYKDFTAKRVVDATIVTTDMEGLLINNDFLTTKDGVSGVYARTTTGEFAFKPVKVLATDGESSIVSEGTYFDEDGAPVETVLVYDEIQKNPATEKEKQK